MRDMVNKNDVDYPLYVNSDVDKLFKKFDANLYRTKILRPDFEDAHKTKSEDNRLIHGIKLIDNGK